MKRIAIMVTGSVGRAYASEFITPGSEIMTWTRNVTEKLADNASYGYGNPPFSEWYSANRNVKPGTFHEAALFGETILK